MIEIQAACGDFPIRHQRRRHDARFHHRCQTLWYYVGIGQLAADDEGNGCFGDGGLIPGNRTQPSLGFGRAYGDEAMKRQFCKWKDVGAVVPIRTSSRIWSSLKVAAGS